MALKYGHFQVKEWGKQEAVGIDFIRPCNDKIRLFETDVAGVINDKQPVDSKYTVVWSYQTNNG